LNWKNVSTIAIIINYNNEPTLINARNKERKEDVVHPTFTCSHLTQTLEIQNSRTLINENRKGARRRKRIHVHSKHCPKSHKEVKRYVCTQSIVKSHEEEKEDTISSSSHVHTSHIDIRNSRLHNTQ
jgi:hypothetical protein